jgi:hypothetical protein
VIKLQFSLVKENAMKHVNADQQSVILSGLTMGICGALHATLVTTAKRINWFNAVTEAWSPTEKTISEDGIEYFIEHVCTLKSRPDLY